MTNEVLELYKIYGANPDRFYKIIEGVYLKLVFELRAQVDSAIAFIEKENLENTSRDEYVFEEVRKVSDSCKSIIDFSENFYKFRISTTTHLLVTGKDAISYFADVNKALNNAVKKFKNLRLDKKSVKEVQVNILDILGDTIGSLDSMLDNMEELLDPCI